MSRCLLERAPAESAGPEYVEGQPAYDFIGRNADLLWLHQNEMWELIADPEPDEGCLASPNHALLWA